MKPGDHLITERFGYLHHGLYLGEGQVMHYAGGVLKDSEDRIMAVPLEEFCQGHPFWIKDYPFRVYDHHDSVQRAYAREGETLYSALINNCEHFVTWCVMGLHHSSQVSNVAMNALAAIPLLEEVNKTKLPRQLVAMAHEVARDTQALKAAMTTQAVLSTGLSTSASISAGALTGLGAVSSGGVSAVSTGLGLTALATPAAPLIAGGLLGFGAYHLIKSFLD